MQLGMKSIASGTGILHHMSKDQMGFKPQMSPKCTSQLPKDQGKLDICCQVQWETQWQMVLSLQSL